MGSVKVSIPLRQGHKALFLNEFLAVRGEDEIDVAGCQPRRRAGREYAVSANDVDPLMQGLDEDLAGWGEPVSRLREALARDELALYCQPVAALSGPVRILA